jgi:ribosomal protein S27E
MRCSDCGKFFPKDEMFEHANGEVLCLYCECRKYPLVDEDIPF